MSAEQVSKLEALLARVTTRRGHSRAPSPPADVMAGGKGNPEPLQAAPAAAQGLIEHRTSPPPAAEVKAGRTSPPGADLEVEVEEGLAEVDLAGIDDEGAADMLSDSVADLDTVAGADEELPASSRRPIQLQPPLSDQGFGDTVETKASHPVPPESGRQVAIPPASDFDGDLSGVRAVTATGSVEEALAQTSSHRAPERAEITRPVVGAAAPTFRGAVPTFSPATFGELLDATLAL